MNMDFTCPVCSKTYISMKGLQAHLSMAMSCKNWKQLGKMKEAELSDDEDWDIEDGIPDDGILNTEDQYQEEEYPADALSDYLDDHPGNFFHFVPDGNLEEEVPLGQAGPGPTTLNHQQRRANRVLDQVEDSRVEDVDETAGKVIRMDDHLHER